MSSEEGPRRKKQRINPPAPSSPTPDSTQQANATSVSVLIPQRTSTTQQAAATAASAQTSQLISTKAAAQPPKARLTFFSLPRELRDQIYTHIFPDLSTFAPCIPALRGTNLNHLPRIDHKTLPYSFSLHGANQHLTYDGYDANISLWRNSHIILRFPCDDSIYGVRRQQKDRLPPARYKTYIPHACYLRQIRSLRLEITLFRYADGGCPHTVPARGYTAVHRELTSLVKAIGNEHSLENLEIRFQPLHHQENFRKLGSAHTRIPLKARRIHRRHRSEQPQNDPEAFWVQYGPHASEYPCQSRDGMCCIRRKKPLFAFGRQFASVRKLEEACRLSVAIDQRVLEPLLGLKGVRNVSIVGRCEPEWLVFLKENIEAEVGKVVRNFVHREYVRGKESR